jgi:branched-chain amino acid transport system permease protein
MTISSLAAFRQVRKAMGAAVVDAHRAWNAMISLALAAAVLALLAPVVVNDAVRRSDMAAGLYVVLAAVGLNFAVGMAGMPSLGQGGFMAIGAFGAALLEVRAGWDPTVAIVAAAAAATLAGAVVGAAAVRAEAPFVAIGTWIVAWLIAFALAAFTELTGGAQGLPVPEARIGVSALGLTVRLTPGVQVELAVVLVSLALGAFAVLRRAPFGVALAAAKDHRAGAVAAGVQVERLRLRAFVASSLLAGLAGALGVHVARLADASAYGPLLSVELFVAVLLGGEGTVIGPIAGALVLVAVPRAASVVGSLSGVARERFEPMIAAVLLVVAVLVGRGGIVGWMKGLRAFARSRRAGKAPLPVPRADRPESTPVTAPPSVLPPLIPSPPPTSAFVWPAALDAWRPASGNGSRKEGSPSLAVREASKSFGGLVALTAVSLDAEAGQVHAVIGPNGSGKTTLLRAVGGTVPLDSGDILVGGQDITEATVRERVRQGVVRTLQSVTSFPRLGVRDNVSLGAVARRRHGGPLRTAMATPLARGEARVVQRQIEALLALVGLPETDVSPERLSATDQRFLMLARACASFPRVLLLDEPAAGMAIPEMRRLAGVVGTLRERGVAVILVEHNLRFVRLVADVVTVLDAGRVIARGTPDRIAVDPAVVEAYLGPARW